MNMYNNTIDCNTYIGFTTTNNNFMYNYTITSVGFPTVIEDTTPYFSQRKSIRNNFYAKII